MELQEGELEILALVQGLQEAAMGGLGEGGGEMGDGDRLPVGPVVSDRDKVLKATEVLKTLLGSEVENSMDELVRGKLPPEVVPTPPPSSTEQQRVHMGRCWNRRRGCLREQKNGGGGWTGLGQKSKKKTSWGR